MFPTSLGFLKGTLKRLGNPRGDGKRGKRDGAHTSGGGFGGTKGAAGGEKIELDATESNSLERNNLQTIERVSKKVVFRWSKSGTIFVFRGVFGLFLSAFDCDVKSRLTRENTGQTIKKGF